MIGVSDPDSATPHPPAGAVPARTGLQIDRSKLATTVPIYAAIVLIWIFFESQTGGRFIGARNLSEMAQEYSYKPLLAIGVVFVLLLGDIDLSVGYLTLLCATTVAVLSAFAHQPAVLAIAGGVVVCTLLGLAQGFLISVLQMPAFVVTLGGFLIFEGLAYHILSGATINVPDQTIASIGTSYLPTALSYAFVLLAIAGIVLSGLAERRKRTAAGLVNPAASGFFARAAAIGVLLLVVVALLDSYRGVPLSLAILLAFALVTWYVAAKTPFGRHVYAVGGNVEAARRAGINTVGVRWIVFGIAGFFAGIAGVMLVGYAQAASTTAAGPDLLLDVISIAVIGGVSLTGGRGNVWSVLLGGLLIASLDSGLNLMSVDSNFVYVIKGVILLLAILLDVLGKRRGAGAARV
jgi:D-xylose transport system permease protein